MQRFFETLNEKAVSYVCLRWHEDLPVVHTGEDIDLLVSDESLRMIESLLTGSKKSGIPVDVYTESGLPGTDYCLVPYFKPELANKALSAPVAYKGLFNIPDPRSYFYTMCYHVVYHKGLRSGLPSEIGDDVAEHPDHDYETAIATIATNAGVPVPEMSLAALDRLLNQAGWRPPTDTLRKYAKKNPWLASVLAKECKNEFPELDGLAVFIVRERAKEFTCEIADFLERNGLQPLKVHLIEASDSDRVARLLRGGNWGKGPWPLSGGKPAAAIIAYDCFPKMEASSENPLENWNATIKFVKERLRRELRRRHPETARYNAVHSSDCPKDALEYITVIDSDLEQHCRLEANRISSSTSHPFKILARLDGLGRRTKVERVEYAGGSVICKSFRPGAERYFERELLARRLFPSCNSIVPIIETGPNYFLMPDLAALKKPPGSLWPIGANKPLMPIDTVAACRDLIRRFRREGFELIDFAPQNIVYDVGGHPRFIDFEYLQKGPEATDDLEGNYAWWPPPDDFPGDRPVISDKSYTARWQQATGLPMVVLAHIERHSMLRLAQLVAHVCLSVINAPSAAKAWVRQISATKFAGTVDRMN